MRWIRRYIHLVIITSTNYIGNVGSLYSRPGGYHIFNQKRHTPSISLASAVHVPLLTIHWINNICQIAQILDKPFPPSFTFDLIRCFNSCSWCCLWSNSSCMLSHRCSEPSPQPRDLAFPDLEVQHRSKIQLPRARRQRSGRRNRW